MQARCRIENRGNLPTENPSVGLKLFQRFTDMIQLSRTSEHARKKAAFIAQNAKHAYMVRGTAKALDIIQDDRLHSLLIRLLELLKMLLLLCRRFTGDVTDNRENQ